MQKSRQKGFYPNVT